jgi:hypothetical protein
VPPLYARPWIAWIVWLWLSTLPKTRIQRFGFAVAWHIGAAWHIELFGQKFFGDAFLSWRVLPLWFALVAIPYERKKVEITEVEMLQSFISEELLKQRGIDDDVDADVISRA